MVFKVLFLKNGEASSFLPYFCVTYGKSAAEIIGFITLLDQRWERTPFCFEIIPIHLCFFSVSASVPFVFPFHLCFRSICVSVQFVFPFHLCFGSTCVSVLFVFPFPFVFPFHLCFRSICVSLLQAKAVAGRGGCGRPSSGWQSFRAEIH
jgi:hypothetical protein